MLGRVWDSKGDDQRDHLGIWGWPLHPCEGGEAKGTWVGGRREGEEIDGGRTHKVTRHVPRINFI